jgi:spermidine synthase
MGDTVNPQGQTTCDKERGVKLRLLIGIGLASFAALLLELALTRLFSVVLFYHFSFLAISIALLGLGAGGVFAYLKKDWMAQHRSASLSSRLCLLNAVAIPTVLLVIVHAPVSLNLSLGNFFVLTVIYIFSAIPFFFTGLLFSALFAREPGLIPQLYGADLGGGAMACLAVIPLLSWLGGPSTVLVSGLATAAASAVWAATTRTRKAALTVVGALVVLIAVNYSRGIFDIVYAKGIRRERSKVEFERWNALSRVEVDQSDRGKVILIDDLAFSAIMHADPHGQEAVNGKSSLMANCAALANVLRPSGEYAIIGPGGGEDVLRALANGSPSITAIEINPIIANAIMRRHYADYSYHLYDRPEVHIHVGDGRFLIRNFHRRFDVVQMTMVTTWAATAAGVLALSENNLYTVEAFSDYFNHLKPEGLVAITRWEFKRPREAIRLVSVAMEALHRMGIRDTRRYFMVVAEGPLKDDGHRVVVLAKKSPVTSEEEAAVRAHLATHPNLVALYMPSATPSNVFSELIASNDPYAFARGYEFNIAPVGDDAPFFFFTLKTARLLHWNAWQNRMDHLQTAAVVLGLLLLISVLAVLAFLILPLLVHGQMPHKRAGQLAFFVAVGLGYMLVEVTFVQRFVLFLGYPTYALTVVVFLLLLSSGAGSLMSHKWLTQALHMRLPLALVVAALILYVFLLPHLLPSMIGYSFSLRLLTSATLLIPLGFAMGMPFPSGLRLLAGRSLPGSAVSTDTSETAIEWAWAMNAAASVLGAVFAMVIAIHFGLKITLACGALAYMWAFALTGSLGAAYAEPLTARSGTAHVS